MNDKIMSSFPRVDYRPREMKLVYPEGECPGGCMNRKDGKCEYKDLCQAEFNGAIRCGVPTHYCRNNGMNFTCGRCGKIRILSADDAAQDGWLFDTSGMPVCPKCAGSLQMSVVDEIEKHGVIPEPKYLTVERKIMDAAKLQVAYKELMDGKRVTKKAICDLGIPFRDKYGLTDLQTLRIMRSEVTLSELLEILEVGGK